MRIDAQLREFSQTQGPATRSIIVEAQTAPVAPPVRHAAGANPRGVEEGVPKASGSSSSSKRDDASYEALGRALEALLPKAELVRLPAVRAFVVDLSAEQLRRVMDLPMVAAVRANRTHRAPKS